MNLESFTGPGSTPSRRRFWDKVTQALNASQKVEGRNVSVDEHQGMGTLINVTRGRSTAAGVCPDPDAPTVDITFSGLTICSPFSDVSLNGTFTLTNLTTGEWTGAGGEWSFSPFTVIALGCSDGVMTVQYYETSIGFQFFLATGPPATLPNGIMCDGGFQVGELGTATI